MRRRFEINDPKLEHTRKALAARRMRRQGLGPMPEHAGIADRPRGACRRPRAYRAIRLRSRMRCGWSGSRSSTMRHCALALSYARASA